jgi:hypothetical protein
VGFLGGVLVERIRFDRERASVLERVAHAEQRLHARLMELERAQQRRGDRQAFPCSPCVR